MNDGAPRLNAVPGMLIRIWVERTQPLAGTAERDDAAPVAFDGWLELLRAISELLGPPPPDGW